MNTWKAYVELFMSKFNQTPNIKSIYPVNNNESYVF